MSIVWQSHQPDHKWKPRQAAACWCDCASLCWGWVGVLMLIQWASGLGAKDLGSSNGSAKILPGIWGQSISLSPLPSSSPSLHTPSPSPLSHTPPKARLRRISTEISSSQEMLLSQHAPLFPPWRWQLVLVKADVWICVPAHPY